MINKYFLPKKIDFYIAKNFLIRFTQISLAFSLLIFFINFLEIIDKVEGSDISIFEIIGMSFLEVPNFLNDIAPSLVLFSAIITFFLLSLKSEITIIRSSGYSLWSLVKPMAISAFLLGIFWITIFNFLSILLMHKFALLENKYVENESRTVVESRSGIWLKQHNLDKENEEILIQAKKVYRDNLEFKSITIWFFDKNARFYRKIDAKKMSLQEGSWKLSDSIINDSEYINKKAETYSIPTNLSRDFVKDRVVNNFQDVKLFSLFELPSLIKSLKEAGFQSEKFIVYFHSLIIKPFLFVSMILIACYFGINHTRNYTASLNLFFGAICGLALYIAINFINALGASRVISAFAATWVVMLICLAIGILLIYKKE